MTGIFSEIATNQLTRRLYTNIYKLISDVSHAFIVQYNRKTLLLETRWCRLPVVIRLPDRRGEPSVLHHVPHNQGLGEEHGWYKVSSRGARAELRLHPNVVCRDGSARYCLLWQRLVGECGARLHRARMIKLLFAAVWYFCIWNEPGHKFLSVDYLKIARLSRKVQQEYAPHAKLIGYSSTKRPGRARQQPNADRLPGFLDDVLSKDHAESIDVLSFHSAHAFKFFEEGQLGHGDETGYVDLLRASLEKNNIRRNLPIWDTERGVPWSSHRSGTHESSADALEVARRLPGIYASSLASNVDRLFWFCMESSTSTIAVVGPRYGFFDANLEPMPHIAAYDAMTEVIGDSRFVRRFERGDGLTIYFFENEKETILMAFNWRRRESSFNLEFSGPGYQCLDVMGNGVVSTGSSVLQSRKVTQSLHKF